MDTGEQDLTTTSSNVNRLLCPPEARKTNQTIEFSFPVACVAGGEYSRTLSARARHPTGITGY